MKAMLATVALVGVLGLTACGSDVEGTAQAADSSRSSTPSATSTTATPSGPWAPLYSQYGATLESTDEANCQVPTSVDEAVGCQMMLARGIDAATAVGEGFAGVERAPMSQVDNLLDAVDRAKADYDKWDDDPNCDTLWLLAGTGAELSQVETLNVVSCSAEATATAYDLQSVAIILKKGES
jgi:hypothetical protein